MEPLRFIDRFNAKLMFNGLELNIIFINNNDFWLKGNDVAGHLGYVNPTKAIIDHVHEKNKIDFSTIIDKLITNGGNYSKRDYNKNQLKTIYINEPGVYLLAFTSKLESADNFKIWIANEVVPSIRTYGGYLIQEKIDLINTKLEAEKNYYEKVLTMKNTKIREYRELEKRNEIIYVITNKQYAINKTFEIGCAISFTQIHNNLKIINKHFLIDNKMYVVYIAKVNNSSKIKQKIYEYLETKLEDPESNFLIINFQSLCAIIEIIKNNDNYITDIQKTIIQNIIDVYSNVEPTIPEPIDIDQHRLSLPIDISDSDDDYEEENHVRSRFAIDKFLENSPSNTNLADELEDAQDFQNNSQPNEQIEDETDIPIDDHKIEEINDSNEDHKSEEVKSSNEGQKQIIVNLCKLSESKQIEIVTPLLEEYINTDMINNTITRKSFEQFLETKSYSFGRGRMKIWYLIKDTLIKSFPNVKAI